ncbi:Fanconi anemia group D2 protein [Cydia splendana]|uniref:Fanconi anemia group D2 protein n=1 Tax=Cydia splendana TaxID=1100963 RepID=UPI00300C58AC
MSVKRCGISVGSQRKKLCVSETYFHKCLRESGLILKHPPEKCEASEETVKIVRNLEKTLKNHMNYPRNVSELLSDFEKECKDQNILQHYVFLNIVRITDENCEGSPRVSQSVVRILLSIPILQKKLTDYIFNKAIDLAALNACGPWIQKILKCFSGLDQIVDPQKIATYLINLLEIASEKPVKLEIITAIPDIIGDQELDNVVTELSRILREDLELVPAILDCFTYLSLSDEQYSQLQQKALAIVKNIPKCMYYPNFVRFLLSGRANEGSSMEIVQGLRDGLGWPTSLASPQEIATSQVLTAAAIRNSMVGSKAVVNAWLKVVSNCKTDTDHKPIDFIILLILYSTSEDKEKLVETLIKKQVKLNILKEPLINNVFENFEPVLKDQFNTLIRLTNSLMRIHSEPLVISLASHIYVLMFSHAPDRQTIVAELLHVGLYNKECLMNTLVILNNVAAKDMGLLKPQSLQMLNLLDYTDKMSLNEFKAVVNIVCGLAYSYENSVIRDDMHMIIRKQLGTSRLKVKIQGIISGVHAIKYLIAKDDDEPMIDLPDDVSYGFTTLLSTGDLREAAEIIEFISRSTSNHPDMTALFYDEMSDVISSATCVSKNFLAWLTDAATNDLQQNFIVDSISKPRIKNLKLTMQYCLNAEGEMDEVIAINIGGIALDEKEVNVAILSPLFRLVATLHSRQHEGDLSTIDALLGCPVVMPEFDIDEIEELDSTSVSGVLDCLIHCTNWFRELLNAFAIQNDANLTPKILSRVQQVQEMESLILNILVKANIAYKPPVCAFNVSGYTGNPADRGVVKPAPKQKPQKKPAHNDTVLPETAKTQPTPNAPIKNKLETIHKLPLRELSLDLLNLLNNELSDGMENLNMKSLKFLLMCLNANLEKILISKVKRITFLSKPEDCVAYDAKKAEECAKTVNEVLPKVMSHLETVTTYIGRNSSENSQNKSGFMYPPDLEEYLTCLEYMYIFLTTYFKWIGFRNHNIALFKVSLRTVSKDNPDAVSLKELLLGVSKYLQKHEKYCLQLSTAVSLINLMKTFQEYSSSSILVKILRDMAKNFLSQQWKTFDGVPEKGLVFNQSVDKLFQIYFTNNEVISLKNLALQLNTEIQNLKGKNDTLETFKCINKSNFPILYRNLGTAVHEAAKTRLNQGLTNAEHLDVWKDVATVLKYMSDVAKTLDNRNNLLAFFKKSLPILKLFISQGVPMMELNFKTRTQEVLEVLKIMQQSTRFLQSLCCHARIKKDMALMSKVPYMRQMLETLVYKVKAVLAANNCSEAFWMGNLKNKDIHGEVIATQASQGEESVDDCDEQLPEDESGDSDDGDVNSVSDII